MSGKIRQAGSLTSRTGDLLGCPLPDKRFLQSRRRDQQGAGVAGVDDAPTFVATHARDVEDLLERSLTGSPTSSTLTNASTASSRPRAPAPLLPEASARIIDPMASGSANQMLVAPGVPPSGWTGLSRDGQPPTTSKNPPRPGTSDQMGGLPQPAS